MSEQETDWPTPSFDRAGRMYECLCGVIVQPDEGDSECALLIAGSTMKLCEDCAQELKEEHYQQHGAD